MRDVWHANKTTISFVFLFAYVTVVGAWAFAQVQAESDERREQNCQVFEYDHLEDVIELRRTYMYLQQLTAAQATEPLNQFVLATLPEVEQRARTDRAPDYCDADGVGLPEPDPHVPDRPPGLQ